MAEEQTKQQPPSGTVADLGRKVKAKYPGKYDSLPDDEVGRRVKAKYPGAYDGFVDTPAAAPVAQTPPAEPQAVAAPKAPQKPPFAEAPSPSLESPSSVSPSPSLGAAAGPLQKRAVVPKAPRTVSPDVDLLSPKVEVSEPDATVVPPRVTQQMSDQNIEFFQREGAHEGMAERRKDLDTGNIADAQFKAMDAEKMAEARRKIEIEKQAVGMIDKNLSAKLAEIDRSDVVLSNTLEEYRQIAAKQPELADQLAADYAAMATEHNRAASEYDNLMKIRQSYARSVGLYDEAAARREAQINEGVGNFGDLVINKLVSGVHSAFNAGPNLGIGVLTDAAAVTGILTPEQANWYNDAAVEQLNADRAASEKMLSDPMHKIFGLEKVTPEYESKKMDNPITGGALMLVEQAPALAAMFTGNPQAASAVFFAQGYDGAMKEMTGPDWDAVPDGDKRSLAVVSASIEAALEKFGASEMVGDSQVTRGIMRKVMAKLNPSMDAGQVRRLVEGETGSFVGNLATRLAPKVAVEAGTEGETSVLQNSLKNIYESSMYDEIGAKRAEALFDNPETADEIWSEVKKSSLMGAIGAGYLTAIPSISEAVRGKRSFEQQEPRQFEAMVAMLKDPEIMKAWKVEADLKVRQGKMSESDVERIMEDVAVAQSVIDKLPDDMDPKNAAEAFRLILERDKLSKKDKNLVAGKVAAINEKLNALAGIKKEGAEEGSNAKPAVEPEVTATPEPAQADGAAQSSAQTAVPNEEVSEESSAPAQAGKAAGQEGRQESTGQESRTGQEVAREEGGRSGQEGGQEEVAPATTPTGGAVTPPSAIPPTPESSPVPDGYVRRFHVTNPDNAESIRQGGLRMHRAKGIEGPKAVYGWPTYEQAKRYAGGTGSAIVEYVIPKDQADRNPVASVGDVGPKDILGVHEDWHDLARSAIEDPSNVDMAAFEEMAKEDPAHAKALAAIKAHQATGKASTPKQKLEALRRKEGDMLGAEIGPEAQRDPEVKAARKRIIDFVGRMDDDRAMKMAKALVPQLKVIRHSTKESLAEAHPRKATNVDGFWDPVDKAIHVGPNANPTHIIAHELMHPVLEAFVGTDEGRIGKLYDELVSRPGGELFVEFGKQYLNKANALDERGQLLAKEEAVVDFLGAVADGKFDKELLDNKFVQWLKDLINRIREKMGIDTSVDISDVQTLKDLAKAIAEASRRGKAIKFTEKDMAPSGGVKESRYEKGQRPSLEKEGMVSPSDQKGMSDDAWINANSALWGAHVTNVFWDAEMPSKTHRFVAVISASAGKQRETVYSVSKVRGSVTEVSTKEIGSIPYDVEDADFRKSERAKHVEFLKGIEGGVKESRSTSSNIPSKDWNAAIDHAVKVADPNDPVALGRAMVEHYVKSGAIGSLGNNASNAAMRELKTTVATALGISPKDLNIKKPTAANKTTPTVTAKGVRAAFRLGEKLTQKQAKERAAEMVADFAEWAAEQKAKTKAEKAALVEKYAERFKEHKEEAKRILNEKKAELKEAQASLRSALNSANKLFSDGVAAAAEAKKQGVKTGLKKAKEYQKQSQQAVKDFIKQMKLDGKITNTQAKKLARSANRVIFSSQPSLKRFADTVDKIMDDVAYATRIDKISSAQAEARERTKNANKAMAQNVREFTDIDPTEIPDAILADYEDALAGMTLRVPSYSKMMAMYGDVMRARNAVLGATPFDAVKTEEEMDKAMIDMFANQVSTVEEYKDLIRVANKAIRKIRALYHNNAIAPVTQYANGVTTTLLTPEEVRDDMIDRVLSYMNDQTGFVKSSLDTLKSGIVADIQNTLNTGAFPVTTDRQSRHRNAMLERASDLTYDELMSMSPMELVLMNDVLDRAKEDGVFDVMTMEYVLRKAENHSIEQKLINQIANAKPIEKTFEDLKDKAGHRVAYFWEGLIGLGSAKEGAYFKYILNAVQKAQAASRRFITASEDTITTIYKKHNLKREHNDLAGMIMIYLREYAAGLDPKHADVPGIGKRDRFANLEAAHKGSYNRKNIDFIGLTRKNQYKRLKAAWDAMPKGANGQVDPEAVYKSYMAGDTKYAPKNVIEFIKEIDAWKDATLLPMQEHSNHLTGKKFERVPFHLKRIFLDASKSISSGGSAGAVVAASGTTIKWNPGVGFEATEKDISTAVETDIVRMLMDHVEETSRQYHSVPVIEKINDLLRRVNKKVKDEGKRKYTDLMAATVVEGLQNEFKHVERTVLSVATNAILRAISIRVLLNIKKAVFAELPAFITSSLIRTRSPKLALAEAYKAAVGKSVVKQLMLDTNSSLVDRDVINRGFEYVDGDLRPKAIAEQAAHYVAAAPEMIGLHPMWAVLFKNEFADVAGTQFDEAAYLANPKAYKLRYKQAFTEASAVADGVYESIAGPATAFGQRRFQEWPLAKRGIPINNPLGRGLTWMTGWPHRAYSTLARSTMALNEMMFQGRSGSYSEHAATITSVAVGAAMYGYLKALSDNVWDRLLVDDDDEEEKKRLAEEHDAMLTWKGVAETSAAAWADMLTAKYSALGRPIMQGIMTAANWGLAEQGMEKERKYLMEQYDKRMYGHVLKFDTPYNANKTLTELLMSTAPAMKSAIRELSNTIKTEKDFEELKKKYVEGKLFGEERDKWIMYRLMLNWSNTVALVATQGRIQFPTKEALEYLEARMRGLDAQERKAYLEDLMKKMNERRVGSKRKPSGSL